MLCKFLVSLKNHHKICTVTKIILYLSCMKAKLMKVLLFSALASLLGSANLVHGAFDNKQEIFDQMQDLVDKIYLQNDLIQSVDEAHQAVFNELKANLYDAPEKMEESKKAHKDRGHKGHGHHWESNIMSMKANRSEVDRLHRNFMSTLTRYKLAKMDWGQFDPMNLIRGEEDNVRTLRGLLDRVSDTLDNLNSIQADYLKAVQEYTKSANIKFKHHHHKHGHKHKHRWGR